MATVQKEDEESLGGWGQEAHGLAATARRSETKPKAVPTRRCCNGQEGPVHCSGFYTQYEERTPNIMLGDICTAVDIIKI